MAEVLSLIHDDPEVPAFNLSHISFRYFQTFRDIIAYLFSRGNSETDTNHPIVVILNSDISGEEGTLDGLTPADKKLVLKYFFLQLNVIIVLPSHLSAYSQINQKIASVKKLITNRISRVETWTGTGSSPINDHYSQNSGDRELEDIISTMSFILSNNTTKSHRTTDHIIYLKDLIIKEIDFQSLLADHSPGHLASLCHAVGHWAFPAHELTNDDLVYSVFLMIKYALRQVEKNHSDTGLHIPTSNELLGFVFMVRDTYKNGNPFHNFRHAVDVLQACFHFLIRLDCLPVFKQLKFDPKSEDVEFLKEDYVNTAEQELSSSPSHSPNHLNHLQTLGLLIAALGHDVGHPGVTNAFMIKNLAPTSILFNDRSVLESFHSSVFINKILAVNWPTLLTVHTEGEMKSELSLREIIISSILATDMAEHFEYIDRLKNLRSHDFIKHNNRVKLISSLLIKCADISNVTRPLRVSSQWAMVLAREFDEVAMLEKKISLEDQELDLSKDLIYTRVPKQLDSILEAVPTLHKGQIFFINTFAENLFNNIAELLPELKYTCDIIRENKEFWLNRNE
ncbi:nucleotide phosphodiesterase [Scheffersomyces xylosifermentans]|uniref:nucleotide phosphodiesterase n=1 Tax=Scheffersomyces xylosifermentans TaxID=1304137 RepID=UPI00315DBF19